MSRYGVYRGNFSYSAHGILVKSVGRDEFILDVGCNEGYIGANCDSSNTFYGIDCDIDALSVAKEHYEEVALVDLNRTIFLPWNIKFDRVIFGDVLEHLQNPKDVFQYLISNYLKPNGYAVVSLPNIANWRTRLNLLFGNFNYQDTGILDRTHLHFYTFVSARRMLENEQIRFCWVVGGSSTFGWFIQHAAITRGLLAQSIIRELQYVPEPSGKCFDSVPTLPQR